MISGSKILSAALQDRTAYTQLNGLDAAVGLKEDEKLIFDEIGQFYEKDEKIATVDKGILISRLERRVNNDTLKTSIVNKVKSLRKVSDVNLVDEVIALKKHALEKELAMAFANFDHKQIAQLLPEYQTLDDVQEADKVKAKTGMELFDTYFDDTVDETLIKMKPKSLNAALNGGIRKRDHILFFARPNVGKSTEMIDQAAYMVYQGFRVLYVSNEDHELDYRDKITVRMLGKSLKWARQNRAAAQAKLDKRGMDRFIFKHLTPGTLREVTALVVKYKPDVLIVDQSRNIKINDTNRVTGLEKVEQQIRTLGQKYDCATISVTQAGEPACGRAVLRMEDVDFSNTGMQASADVMIGMGMKHEWQNSGHRMITVCKNKRSGDQSPKRVRINFETIRTEDV